MKFAFDFRPSDSPLVEAVWRTRHEGGGSFISAAASQWEMVVTRQKDKTTLSLRGPETKASPAPIPEDADFLGITFKHGAFMPHLSKSGLVDGGIHLPQASGNAFWLQGALWQFPDFENADTFIERLVRADLLAHDQVVTDVLRGQTPAEIVKTAPPFPPPNPVDEYHEHLKLFMSDLGEVPLGRRG